MAYPTPDANAGHKGNNEAAVATNPANVAPADRSTAVAAASGGYDVSAFSAQPGAAARANGYPRVS